MTSPVSRYRLIRVEDDGLKLYELICRYCHMSDKRGITRMTSTGIYFSQVLMCPSCNRWSRYYSKNPQGVPNDA